MKTKAAYTAKKTNGNRGRTKTRSILLSLTLVLITALNTRAQGFHLGIKAGANIFKVDGQSFDQSFQFGYNIGGFAELNFTKQWGIQPELMWNQTNYRTGDHFNA